MRRIGLTGGIAAGKSTVASRMAAQGAQVIDYDKLTRMLQEPQSPAILRLAARFGDDILDAEGGVDRVALGRHVFGQDDRGRALADLNAIMHPLVYRMAEREERRILSDGRPHVVVHDVPLLAQVIDGLPFRFDHVVTVVAPVDVRVRRLVETRGMDRSTALVRVREQGDEESRLAIADHVIDSDRPMEQMFETVDMLVDSWIREME
ncbi:dephospho-CoA kinase [Bifidobacterium cuniculi]|nr:dephospho-CoA kinase [Bifidobacterium cuniculi]